VVVVVVVVLADAPIQAAQRLHHQPPHARGGAGRHWVWEGCVGAEGQQQHQTHLW